MCWAPTARWLGCGAGRHARRPDRHPHHAGRWPQRAGALQHQRRHRRLAGAARGQWRAGLSAAALPSTVQAPALYAGDTPPPPPPVLSVGHRAARPTAANYTAPASLRGGGRRVTPGRPGAASRTLAQRHQGGRGHDLAPYAFAQSALAGGSYRYEARAVRSDGAVTVSGAVTVQRVRPRTRRPPR